MMLEEEGGEDKAMVEAQEGDPEIGVDAGNEGDSEEEPEEEEDLGGADYWWAHSKDGLRNGEGIEFGWKEFKAAIRYQFYPPHVRKDKSNEFARFEMGNMTVDEYHRKFMEYLKYCPEDVPTEAKKMQRFELGLAYEVQKLIESDRYETLDQLYKRAAQIGNVIRKEKEKAGMVGEKRKDFGGSSSNPPQNFVSKKQKTFGGFPSNQSRPGNGQNSDSKPQRPVVDKFGRERHYYCKRCSKDHPGKDCNGNLVDCRHCGKKGHRDYECFHKNGFPDQQGGNQRGFQPGQYGNGRNGNGRGNPGAGNQGQRFQRNFGGAQQHQPAARNDNAGGQRQGNGNQGAGNSGAQATGRLTAVSSREAEQARDVVTGMFCVDSKPVKVLFDSGASYSFISKTKIKDLELVNPEKASYTVAIPSGKLFHCDILYRDVPLKIGKTKFFSDLFVLEMDDLDIILGMDWLGRYKAVINCEEQSVILRGSRGETVKYRKVPKGPNIKIVSSMVSRKLVEQGCSWYLCSINKVEQEEVRPENIPIVCDFVDVFPDEIPGMPPVREVDFTIDLVLGTGPISKAPYRMAPKEMEELKSQLEELLEKGFIRPSISL